MSIPQHLFIAGVVTLMLLSVGCTGSHGQDQPSLRGYHTVSVTYGAAGLAGTESRDILFRFATPEGYEIERHVTHLPVK